MRLTNGARRAIWWALAAALTVVVILIITTAVLLRGPSLKARIAAAISTQLNLDTEIETLSFSLVPRPRVSGVGLTLRIPNRPDLPPFIRLENFSADVGLLSALRRHVGTVHAGGLRISVPPGAARDDLPGQNELSGPGGMSKVIVDHFLTDDAELTFVPRDTGQKALTFAIHNLAVDDIGFERIMPFKARLTNPVPEGLVEATGTIGPWRKDDVTLTEVGGEYTFTDADLSTINGIGGTLTSTGKFGGRLTAIEASGHADVPDFSLDLGGKPVSLSASFTTVVDGTDGTTFLKHVEARLGNTDMRISGAITNLPGPGNRQVDLDVHVDDGRIEDLLSLAFDAKTPMMTGDVILNTKVSLPPGAARVRNRLKISGDFGLASTTFTDAQVRAKIEQLSRRGQGKSNSDPMERVLTNLKGRFVLASGTASLTRLTFAVSGAKVALDGTYDLADSSLDFRGTLQMHATMSQAVGGFKSIFIKPFDRLFKKNGAGAELPIRISGTRDQPKFAVEVRRIFKKE